MAATEAKIVGIWPESRPASQELVPVVRNPLNPHEKKSFLGVSEQSLVISAIKGPMEMKVSNKKGSGFYIKAAVSFLKGVDAQEARDGLHSHSWEVILPIIVLLFGWKSLISFE